MRKLVGGLLALALVAFVGAYFASPFLAAQRLRSAAESGDRKALEELVDFPSFRASLKEELRERLMSEARQDPGGSALSGLGMMLAPALVSGAVDVLVTPDAIAAMVEKGQAPDPTRRPEPATSSDEPRLHQGYGYRNLDTFAVTLTREDQPDQQLALLMRRHGLFGWKLSAVDLNPQGG